MLMWQGLHSLPSDVIYRVNNNVVHSMKSKRPIMKAKKGPKPQRKNNVSRKAPRKLDLLDAIHL